METENLALWRSSLDRALHRNRSLPESRYFQLATVGKTGHPANRTVVYRGFRDKTNQIQMISDLRSEKIEQINDSPWGEICWYFSKTREQFRLSGILKIIEENQSEPSLQQSRSLVWQELSNAARLQFAWPNPKNSRVTEKEAFLPPSPGVNEPLPNFCLLLFNPIEVDHLELRGEPQNRWIYQLDQRNEWIIKSVNP